ncbi:MAG: magnesium transporter [Eubacteriales bacterium]|nr:magnesium transporter [Eubacteriales bacterium]
MTEKNVTLESTIQALVQAKRYTTLRDILVTMNPADVAALFGELEVNALPLLFRLLPKELAAETFVEMETDAQELLLHGFSDSELKDVVDELYVDDAVDLVEEMPANVVKRILRQADPEKRRMINEILRYPDDSAGSIMTTEFVDFPPNLTVEDAEKRIRRTGFNKETINTCYVTEPGGRLIGAVSIRTLLLAELDDPIERIMEPNVISVMTTEDQESVAQMFSKYDFTAMPVVDGENRLVGIVTVDDVLDVLQDEATEDIEKMAAITPSDKPYMKMSVFGIWLARVPWLLLLMISATFTGLIINHFENALSACVTLTAYIPMLMGTGGNSGSQASVAVIRGLSLGEVEFSDLFRVVWKEFRVALLCGLTLSVCNFGKLMLFDKVGLSVALTVCLTLAVVVLAAKMIGSMLPLLGQKLGFDPAVMASPFITTIVDALALLIYFQIAVHLLPI